METEEEAAGRAIGMFCEQAAARTGDEWAVEPSGDGWLWIVQRFAAANKDPGAAVITGALFCSGRTRTELAEAIAASARKYSLDLGSGGWAQTPAWPLPYLSGCSSVEELLLRMEVAGGKPEKGEETWR